MSRTNPVYRQQVDHYRSRFRELADSRGDDPGWLASLRADAMARFGELGFPSTQLEEWRYTNVAPLAKLAFESGSGEAVLHDVASLGLGVEPVVLVNGRVASELGDTPGLRVESFEDLRTHAPERLRAHLGRTLEAKDRSFALLNTAFASDGLLVTAERDAALESPLHVLAVEHASARTPTASHPRICISAEVGSRLAVVVEHVSSGAGEKGLTNAATEVVVSSNARVDLVLVQSERDDCSHVSSTACRVERNGRLHTHTLTLGGDLVRNDLDVLLADEGAECNLRGLFLGRGRRLVDNHTSVDHAMPHGTSRELYKGILGGQSRGVFRGRVIVRPDAQKTDATQSNANLLLGQSAGGAGAEIDTKPQLEIYADDVKCSHGSTIGQLDENALFYLRSRGIGSDDAKTLLIRAFANEIAEAAPGPILAAALGERIETALESLIEDQAGSAR